MKLMFPGLLFMNYACSQQETAFKASTLNQLGDSIKYGSYIIYKIGEGIYKINDPGSPEAIKGGLVGTDIYLICGGKKALMIDLGNNYIDGYEKDKIAPRENAKEEFLDIVYGIIGKMPLEVAVTHMHPDHCGMTKAFLRIDVPLWIGEGENLDALKSMHNLDPSSLYQTFKHGEKRFDLGGGRVVETFLVRGHSNGGTVFLLTPEMMLFTGDAFSPGPRKKRSLKSGESVILLAEDTQKLVDYITASFLPYERYALQVYTGHSGEMMYSKDPIKVDAGYGDWRFLQNMAACANGIVNGTWSKEGSGFCYSENTVVALGIEHKTIEIVYYLGGISLPIEAVNELRQHSLKLQNNHVETVIH